MRKKITKKYVLADFLENELGDLIIASDSMKDIKKSAKQWRIDTDDECMLVCLQRNTERDSYTPIMNL